MSKTVVIALSRFPHNHLMYADIRAAKLSRRTFGENPKQHLIHPGSHSKKTVHVCIVYVRDK